MHKWKWHWVMAILVMVPCSQAMARSVYSEFSDAWGDRLARYNTEYNGAAEKLKSVMADFRAAAAANAPDAKTKLSVVFAATDDVGYRAGRAQMSQTLIQFMKDKPSAERAELWLQEQIDKLAQSDKDVKVQFEKVSAMKIGENGATADSVFLAMGTSIFSAGSLRGQVNEMALINDNLSTYYRAKNQQDADRRAKWKAILGSMGQALQNQSQANSGFMMNCTTIGNSTNCMGM